VSDRQLPARNAADSSAGDSALAELARDPLSRKRFMRMAGPGAAAALTVLLAACGGDNESESGTATSGSGGTASRGDLDILNYALTLEYLETDFYRKVNEAGLFSGKTADLLKRFGDEEAQHVDALRQTIRKLGGTPVAAPRTRFPLDNANQVARLAATVENLGANAYLGQAALIKSKEVLAAALSIHSVEARHAAVLNRLVGQNVSPDGPFAKPASRAQVLRQVEQFIVS
jgi:rubrerythrin